MGYFSNGSEGMDYEERWCDRCANRRSGQRVECPILSMHSLWNYDACKDKEKDWALQLFIPRTKDGLGNEQCRMFVETS